MTLSEEIDSFQQGQRAVNRMLDDANSQTFGSWSDWTPPSNDVVSRDQAKLLVQELRNAGRPPGYLELNLNKYMLYTISIIPVLWLLVFAVKRWRASRTELVLTNMRVFLTHPKGFRSQNRIFPLEDISFADYRKRRESNDGKPSVGDLIISFNGSEITLKALIGADHVQQTLIQGRNDISNNTKASSPN
jgi:hypothetical protein